MEARVEALEHLQADIQNCVRSRDWERLSQSLARLSRTPKTAEIAALVEKAQSIQEVLGHRGSGRVLLGARLSGMLDDFSASMDRVVWEERHLHSSRSRSH